MIGELKNPPVINISRQESEEKPHGNFVLLPAPNGTLLVKSIAVQELLNTEISK
jgi:phosphosulfolactate phosphohydrolase-like enzyme